MHKKLFDIKKIIAVIILICILTTTLLSIGFIISRTNHYCTGEGCPVCSQINDCINNILIHVTGLYSSACLFFAFYEFSDLYEF